jgi:CheY-like chemotaxis protein
MIKRKLNCIMLIDDNKDDNLFHSRVIKKADAANSVIVYKDAREALGFLTAKEDHPDQHPDLIFLDINMPGMNGWEFLDEYSKLDIRLRSSAIIVMLTTSMNPDDEARSSDSKVTTAYRTKPLTEEMLSEIIEKYF